MTQTIILPRRALLLGGAAFALAGCSDLIGPSSAPVQLYALKPSGGAATAGPKVPWHLSVGMPTATDYLDRSRIALIKSDTAVDYFADSQWTDHLPVLVQEALVEAFENSGRIDGVAAESDGFKADYVLQTDLRDFEARYDQPDGIPTAVVRIEAKIAPTIGRSIVSSLQASHQVQATQNSVAAAVQAMDAALGQALSDIVNWALSQPPPMKR
jgi:cholesterol transport system auxiliary component